MSRNLNKKLPFNPDGQEVGGVESRAETVHRRSRYRAATLLGRTLMFATILVLEMLAEIADEDS